MREKGLIPDRYIVHHKNSLDDEGENVYENLVLVLQHPFHKALTNHQNYVTKGFKPDVRNEGVVWPEIKGIVYPPQMTDEIRVIIDQADAARQARPTRRKQPKKT